VIGSPVVESSLAFLRGTKLERFEEPVISKVSLPIDWAAAHGSLRRERRKPPIAKYVDDRFAPKLVSKHTVNRLSAELDELENRRLTALQNQRTPDWARGAGGRLALPDRNRMGYSVVKEGSPILSRHLAAICL
jgi:hypothetical protein